MHTSIISLRCLLILHQEFEISPGYNPTGFFAKPGTSSVDRSKVAIPGTGGRILAVWY